jgi:hypothetical protein
MERGFTTHEHQDSLRIFGPIIGYLDILLLSRGKIHRPQFSRRVPIVLGWKIDEREGERVKF